LRLKRFWWIRELARVPIKTRQAKGKRIDYASKGAFLSHSILKTERGRAFMEALLSVENKFLLLFAISGAALIGLGQASYHIGLGLLLLTFGAIYAFTLQSKRFQKWLEQYF
jgi:hypothetical protein